MTVTIRIAGESPVIIGHKSMLPGEMHQVEHGIAEQAIARYGLGVIKIVGETATEPPDSKTAVAPESVIEQTIVAAGPDLPPEQPARRRKGNA